MRVAKRKLSHRLGSVDPEGNPLAPGLFGVQLWVQIERQKNSVWKTVGKRVPLGHRAKEALSKSEIPC